MSLFAHSWIHVPVDLGCCWEEKQIYFAINCLLQRNGKEYNNWYIEI